MMTVELNLAVNREAVAERATRLGEPSWMVAKRQDALDLAPTLPPSFFFPPNPSHCQK